MFIVKYFKSKREKKLRFQKFVIYYKAKNQPENDLNSHMNCRLTLVESAQVWRSSSLSVQKPEF